MSINPSATHHKRWVASTQLAGKADQERIGAMPTTVWLPSILHAAPQAACTRAQARLAARQWLFDAVRAA